MVKITGGVAYKIIILLVSLGVILGLNKISNECHKVYHEIKGVRIEMARANVTARGCTKRVADEIKTTREEGTKVRVWFW